MKGTKKVRYRQSGRKGQVTIVVRHAITPMVIFDAKRLNPAWTEGEFPGTKYSLSDSGWITSDLFEAWLCEHFIQHAVSARPLLLVLDGHSTHYQPQLLRVAKEFDIIILCLPPHTTHEEISLGQCVPLILAAKSRQSHNTVLIQCPFFTGLEFSSHTG